MSRAVHPLFRRSLSARSLSLLVVVGLAACTDSGSGDSGGAVGDGGSSDGGADGGATGELTGVAASLDEDVPTVVTVSWEAPEAGSSWVEYGLDGRFDLSTPVVDSSEGQTERVLMGLKANHDYTVRAVTETADGVRMVSEELLVELPARASGLPSLQIMEDAGEFADDGGFILFTVMQNERSWVAIVDREGDYVWWHDGGEGVLAPTVELAADGQGVLFSTYDNGQQVDVGQLHRVDLQTGDKTTTRTVLGHHDFAELPDGSMAWIAFDTRTVDWDGRPTAVTGDAIVEGPEGAVEDTPLDTIWSVFDTLEPEPGCSHTEDLLQGTGGLDWIHANSLMYDEGDDAYYIQLRHIDTFVKVDRATGQVLWTLGEHGGDLRLQGDSERPLAHSHISHVWDGGMVVFDNGDHRGPQRSRIVEFSWDEDAGTYEEVWSYNGDGSEYVAIMGDARRLPEGSTLTTWASLGSIRQVADDQVVWRADTDIGSAVGRVRWIADLYDVSASLGY